MTNPEIARLLNARIDAVEKKMVEDLSMQQLANRILGSPSYRGEAIIWDDEPIIWKD